MGRNNIKEDFNYRFVNPYNFIPLGKKCLRQLPQVKEQDCYTGYFDCSMSVLTPLFIPNTSSAVRLLEKKEWAAGEKEGYLGYDFFSYDDWSKEQPFTDNPPSPPSNPVIPGSEIRGAVRSVYEAAFNGCMSSIDGKRDLSRRCGEIKNPGMLYWNNEQRQWYLKNCGKARLRVEQKVESKRKSYEKSLVGRKEYDCWKEGQEIWIRIGKSNLVTDYKTNIGVSKGKQMSLAGYKKGHLHKGEYIEKKKCEAVFYETGGSKPTKVCTEDVALLAKVLNEYRDNKKNGKIENDVWYKEYEISKDGSPILVYYAKDMKGHFYMCPACIGRESFKKTLDSLLKNNGEYQPCNDEHLCQACQIFGMMDKAEKPETYAYGSKIRFTDAMLIHPAEDSAALFEEPIVLPELGEPRPSAVEFYTESPYKVGEKYGGEKKQGYWTYDYKYTQTKNKQRLKELLYMIISLKYEVGNIIGTAKWIWQNLKIIKLVLCVREYAH